LEGRIPQVRRPCKQRSMPATGLDSSCTFTTFASRSSNCPHNVCTWLMLVCSWLMRLVSLLPTTCWPSGDEAGYTAGIPALLFSLSETPTDLRQLAEWRGKKLRGALRSKWGGKYYGSNYI
jgi:hypothetical protein